MEEIDSSASARIVCKGAAVFRSIEEIVQISQWVQAEGYRYAYQAGRRRKVTQLPSKRELLVTNTLAAINRCTAVSRLIAVRLLLLKWLR